MNPMPSLITAIMIKKTGTFVCYGHMLMIIFLTILNL